MAKYVAPHASINTALGDATPAAITTACRLAVIAELEARITALYVERTALIAAGDADRADGVLTAINQLTDRNMDLEIGG